MTEHEISELVEMLRSGNYVEVAARACGVQLDELLADPEIAAALDQAVAAGEAALIARIKRAADGDDWQAAAWLAERAHPERWSRPGVRRDEEPAPAGDSLDQLAERRAARRASS